MKERADLLEEVISYLDTLYEVGEPCILSDELGNELNNIAETKWKFKSGQIMPDTTYDALRNELKSIRPNSNIFLTPTVSKLISTAKKVKHNPPLTSIAKCCHEDRTLQEQMLFKWLKECELAANIKNAKVFDLDEKIIDGIKYDKKTYNGKVVTYLRDYFYQSYKLDGVSLALYIKKGTLISAGLRPADGILGDDVTEQALYVNGIPKKLNNEFSGTIRGEVICLKSDFAKVQEELAKAGEDLRKNPRNHAAGGIRQFKDPSKVKCQRLTFIAHEAISDDPSLFKTEIEKAKYINELGIKFIKTEYFNFYDLDKMEEKAKDLDYEVDGIVIGVNSIEEREQLGRIGDSLTGDPKGKRAWKFAEEKAYPVIKDIEWNTGRLGDITPVAIFDGVELAGTTVQRAALHNYGFMLRNNIDIETKVILIKSGKIIPKIIGVFSNPCKNDPNYPDFCPSCNSSTKLVNSNSDMYEISCLNKDCPAKKLTSLYHYLDTFGVLGLGESKIETLISGGKLKTFADFYKLDVIDAMNSGLTERQSLLAIAAIHMIPQPEKQENEDLYKLIRKAKLNKKVVPLWKLFASFGIESAGKSIAKLLVDYFRNFDNIRNATIKELSGIDNIGEKTALTISEYLTNNKDMINDLLNYIEPELPSVGLLTGKSYVFTGTFDEDRKSLEAKVEALGGKASSSVSKNTSFVVVGSDAGSKKDKAEKLGIAIIDINEFRKHIKE